MHMHCIIGINKQVGLQIILLFLKSYKITNVSQTDYLAYTQVTKLYIISNKIDKNICNYQSAIIA